MSREDPQFKLRMPQALRDQAEQAAKSASRSLNAELVARLEASFLSTTEPNVLMTAERARELAAIAREGIPEEIRKRTLKAINRGVELGQSAVIVDFKDLKLDGMTEKVLEDLIHGINEELKKAGYDFEWDGGESLWISF